MNRDEQDCLWRMTGVILNFEYSRFGDVFERSWLTSDGLHLVRVAWHSTVTARACQGFKAGFHMHRYLSQPVQTGTAIY